MLKRSSTAVLGALAIAGLIGAGITVANSADDPIAKRQALMKSNGANAKLIGGMMESGFDATKAAEAANAIATSVTEFVTLFPDTSKAGDTKAKAEIWTDWADFEAKAKSLAADATATATAAATGEAAFKEAAGKMFGNCKSCHEKYKGS